MADLIYSGLKGGAVRQLNYNASSGIDCDACNSALPTMPEKINVHEVSPSQQNWIAFAPRLNSRDKDCVAVDELGTVGVKQVPAGYVLHRIWVPPYSVLKSIGVNNKLFVDDYGTTDTSMNGLIYDVIANLVDNSTSPPTVGAAVTAAAIPAAFTGVVAATAGKMIAVVAPTTGGYVTGAQGVLISFVVQVPPTEGLSNVKGEITIQCNVEGFNSLIR